MSADATMMVKKILLSVKIEEDVYRMAKTAASWHGLHISEYLSDLLRPLVKKECAKIGKDACSGKSPPGGNE